MSGDLLPVAGLEPLAPDAPAFDPREYLRLLRRRWPIIAAVTLLALGLGLVHYLVTPKLYRASTTLRIEQRSLLTVSSERNPYLEAWLSAKYYPTQYRLLKSRGFAERVVRDLDLGRDPRFARPRAASAVELDPDTLAGLAMKLQSGLRVEPIEGTELVTLHYVTADPELATDLVNGLAQSFIEWEVESRSQKVGEASDFLSSQVATLTAEIADKEIEVQNQRRHLDVVAFDIRQPGSSLTEERLASLNTAYAAAIADRLEKETRYNELRSAGDEVVAARTAPRVIEQLQRDLQALRKDYEAKLQIYKPNWPGMEELQAKITEAEDRLRETTADLAERGRRNAQQELQTARREEQGLVDQMQKLKLDALNLTSAAAGYHNLLTEVSIRRDLLNRMLRQLSETGVSASLAGGRDSNVYVVDRALVPGGAFRPSLRNDLMAGLAAGLVLGVGLVLLIHFLDRTVKSAEQLERVSGLPVLAVIPDVTSGRGYGYRHAAYRSGTGKKRRSRTDKREELEIELLPQVKPSLAASEAYRSLRTALLLSSADELRVVTITSANSGEGKTATSLNLAVVLAQLGLKVLLVDADLRKPRLHKVLEVSNRAGLVNHLTGSVPIDAIEQPTAVPNLKLCPSGPHPPNPSELLASDRMAEYLQAQRERHDFVILDSPPLMAVTDAILTGSLGDGVVLCFRAGKVLREDIRTCRERLERAEVRVFGAVLNRFEPHRGGYYSRRYQYYEAYVEEVEHSTADSAA